MTKFLDDKVYEAAFAEAVSQCLVVFHDFRSDSARERAKAYLARFAERTKGSPLIFHEEPFYLACKIARNELPLDDKFMPDYRKIMESVSFSVV
ncbi:MAG TPA: hypothetical protein VI876_11625 [Dehalococcoidia bacterium]|nr:hypothetical protein [Dehalococcoidia bacterium]